MMSDSDGGDLSDVDDFDDIDMIMQQVQNCPKAWHGQFARGDKKYSTIMLEAVASYDFGVAGANNDLTVLNNSPLFDDLLDDIAPLAPFECIQNVGSDGNCGFRAVAFGLGLSEDQWPRIRSNLVRELEARQRQYKYVFGTIGYEKIYSTVKFVGRWMEMADTSLVIASAYKKVVVNLSDAGGFNTSFPLWSRPSQSDSHETIVVAHVDELLSIQIRSNIQGIQIGFVSNLSLKIASSKDLWKACNSYGNVVDVFIPNKKSKSGKRFAFVRPLVVDSSPALVLDESCVVDRVASWFKSLGNAQADFVAKERIVWVDIEGVPIHAWPRATFVKIGSKWGDVVEIEESKDDLFARKRICIKTKQEDNILDKFKIIVKGRNFVLELRNYEDTGDVNKKASSNLESDSDAVSDTFFGEFNDNPDKEQSLNQPQNVEAASLDPFNIYPLLDRKNIGTSDSVSDKSIPFPPGFTPPEDYTKPDDQVSKDKSPGSSQRRSESFCSRIMEECQQDSVQQLPVDSNSGFYSGFNENGLKKGGSLLDVLDGMVKVGQAMGYDMGGCMKDMEKIIGSQGVRDVIQ
ncbi:RNA-directed DNA polymerase, eukaryota [Tanacetum coccineum]|uniref:RNA-directed DNA polymerase, eukaryota n=1 Tax=Tanacetum coccineum TaxID=301880 RepID=A0ABQ4XDD6_9ASTR